MTIHRTCPVCGEQVEVEVAVEEYNMWHGGALIQNVWPHWTAEQRELLISGTHPACWEKLFGEEER